MAVRFIPAVISAIDTPVQLLASVPSQGAQVTITNGSSSNPIYLGSSDTVSSVNGAVVPPYAVVTLSNVVSGDPVFVVAHVIDTGGTAVGVIYGDLS